MDERLPVSERTLQRAAHRLLSDPSRQWRTAGGTTIQVLSPGRINPHEGPDFLTIALYMCGEVRIGDAEFHRAASDWHTHKHSADPRYSNVILHIILRNDAAPPEGTETLVLNEEEVAEARIALPEQPQDDGTELQHYALLRMLRKTAECAALLKSKTSFDAFAEYVGSFMYSLAKKRRRPVHTAEELQHIAEELPKSGMAEIISRAAGGRTIDFTSEMTAILKQKIGAEGGQLRREIAVNCFLPMMLAVADEQLRTQIFLWYWSVEASGKYGLLARRFPAMSQRYFWQQQGMLEYIREHGSRDNIAAETVLRYGFADALHFYKHAASPVADEVIMLSERSDDVVELDEDDYEEQNSNQQGAV